MNKFRKKTELLSPAGSFEILRAVAEAGADAVYAAGNKFGARAYADNFTEEELLEALDYLHLRGKRLYLTVNTMLKEPELETLPEYLFPLYQAGLDAVIVQDLGVLRLVRENFPGLPIHASTQMTITGSYGAKLLLEAGCSRIVTARELSFKEIAHIYEETGAEIESFVHGALCYSYSGQCLLSSMIGGRSGNRGRCAQPCRLPYQVTEWKEHTRENLKGKKENYPLSLKDLCTIDLLPELIQSGVHSFKIEGRMKQAPYAAGVTRIYRKYLELCENEPEKYYQVEEKDRQKLLSLGSRCGFTDGYYKQKNGKNMITFTKPSHEKERMPELEESLHLNNKEKVKGILRLWQGNSARLLLEYRDIQVEAEGETVQPARKQPLSRESILNQMQKTGNTMFVFEKLELEMDEDIFLSVKGLNQLRRDGLERLKAEILKKFRRDEERIILEKGRDNLQSPKKAKGQKNGGGEPRLCVLTETREQFQMVLNQQLADRIYLEESACLPKDSGKGKASFEDCAAQAHKMKKECYLALPYVFRLETARWFALHWQEIESSGMDGYLIRNYEELQFLREQGVSAERIQGDYNLYAYTEEGRRMFEELSLEHTTLPVELNIREMKNLDCRAGEMIVYGYQPLMLSSQCVHKNTVQCDGKEKIHGLRDRLGNLFPVKNCCRSCYNVIYNIKPLSLFHHLEEIRSLNPQGMRLSFTVESPKEMEQVFACFHEAVHFGTVTQETYDYTNGHFKRGVE